MEQFFAPRQRLAGQKLDNEIWTLFPLKEHSLQCLNEDSDCINILDSINQHSFDHLSDLIEYIQTDSLYMEITKSSAESPALLPLCTTLKYLFSI